MLIVYDVLARSTPILFPIFEPVLRAGSVHPVTSGALQRILFGLSCLADGLIAQIANFIFSSNNFEVRLFCDSR